MVFIHEIRLLQSNINKFLKNNDKYSVIVKNAYKYYDSIEEDYLHFKDNYKDNRAFPQLSKLMLKLEKKI